MSISFVCVLDVSECVVKRTLHLRIKRSRRHWTSSPTSRSYLNFFGKDTLTLHSLSNLNLLFDKKNLELIECTACLVAFRWVHFEMTTLLHVNAQLYLFAFNIGHFFGKSLVCLDAWDGFWRNEIRWRNLKYFMDLHLSSLVIHVI